jgi:hypothetical protein
MHTFSLLNQRYIFLICELSWQYWQASQGVYEDNSGPEMSKLLQKMSDDESWPLTVEISCAGIVPDEKGMLIDTFMLGVNE